MLLDEKQGPGVAGGVSSTEDDMEWKERGEVDADGVLVANEVEEDDQCLSLSSAGSTAIVSPETPAFPVQSQLAKATEMTNLAATEGEDASEQEGNMIAKEQDPIMPSLLNGARYEQTLQLQPGSSSSLGRPEHTKRTSYLQDQFPSFDEPEETPLTLEDSSDHSNIQEEQQPLLGSEEESLPVPQASETDDHPLLRRRHNNKSTLLSKLTIPKPATVTPAATHHEKTDSILQEEKDYYPQPDDFVAASNNSEKATTTPRTSTSPSSSTSASSLQFTPHYTVTKYLQKISQTIMRSPQQYDPTAAATWIGFWAMFLVTCSNYVLMPMRDAIALAVGVEHIPKLTLASTVLAVFSSVPIGWLFEAPDPARRHLWKKIGLTRGETQGTSLALFYRFFAMALWSYAIGFKGVEFIVHVSASGMDDDSGWIVATIKLLLQHLGKAMYIAFFLVVHLMKLHSLSLVWGVTTEAMEYEENARKRQLAKQQQQQQQQQEQAKDSGIQNATTTAPSSKTRLQRLAFVGFGGTVGGILGSIIASSLARVMRLSGLLVFSALMLEAAAQLAIELGRIMHKHWMEQQLFPSSEDLASLDPSMKRSASLGSMKRIASGNSLSRVKSMSELKGKQLGSNGGTSSSLQSLEQRQRELEAKIQQEQQAAEDSFTQRLMRGIRTILQSRLLMAIFTYNALYASTTVLLSFQRAELVANRKAETTAEANTAFLAKINMASSVAVFALQASGLGAYVAHMCGSRGTLALMPMVRLLGVLTLAYWHQTSNGEPPNLLLFLMLDECCRVMNMAVAKPVRESLWRGLSNEARYEAKPIVDTLANRWGGGSAAFLVSSINRLLDLFGVPEANNGEARVVFGFPPVLFLCMIVAAWWAGVSADLGQIRRRIDLELKKMQ